MELRKALWSASIYNDDDFEKSMDELRKPYRSMWI